MGIPISRLTPVVLLLGVTILAQVSQGNAQGDTCDASTLTTSVVANSADWNCSSSTTANTTFCTGACAPGYEGNTTLPVATCNAPNFIVTGGCRPAGCNTSASALPVLDNVTWECQLPSIAHNTSCLGRCVGGYTNTSAILAKCNTATWTTEGGCQPAGCSVLPPANNPANVNWTASCAGTAHNASCTGGCVAGYEVVPANTPTVNCSFGVWGTPTGSCRPASCSGVPPQPDNITVTWNCSAGGPHGTVCNATTIGNCSTGFTRPNTALTATCNFGQWVYTGGCVAAGCTTAPNVTAIQNVTSWPCSLPIAHNANCTANCAATLERDPSNPPTALCRNGVYSYSGTCRAASCLAVPPDVSVNWTCTGGVQSGASCTGSCATGYSPGASAPAASCSFGRWNVTMSCQPAACPQPPVSDASVNYACYGTNIPHNTTCFGSCASGYSLVTPSVVQPTARCQFGQYVVSGICQPSNCSNAPPAAIASNVLWDNCLSGTRHNSTCAGTCVIGATPNNVTGAPVAQCNFGAWLIINGSCTAPVNRPCNGSNLPALDQASSWSASCQAGVIPDSTVCNAVCNTGFTPINSSNPLNTRCRNGTWTAVNGTGCASTGCNSQPNPSITVNSTWLCRLPATPLSTCTGGCFGVAQPDVKDPPVATCFGGTWILAGGTCTGGGSPTFFGLTATSDVIAILRRFVESGSALEVINKELEPYLPMIIAELKLTNFTYTDIELANLFVVNIKVAARSLDVEPAQTQTREQLTVGYQLKSERFGVIPPDAETRLGNAIRSTPGVVGRLTNTVTAAVAESGVLPVTFNFSTVAVAQTDAVGNAVANPVVVAPSNCYMYFLGAAATTTELCGDTSILEASFTYAARDVASLQFVAEAFNSSTSTVVDSSVVCNVTAIGIIPAKVTCRKRDGTPFNAGLTYRLSLKALYNCGSNRLDTLATALRSIRSVPQLTVTRQVPGRITTCSSAGKADVVFNYQLRGDSASDPAVLSAAVRSTGLQGVTCEAEVEAGVVAVSCTGNLRPGRQLSVTLNMTATPGSCRPITKIVRQNVAIVCCKDGAGYSRPRSGAPKCFQHYLPTTTRAQCRDGEPAVMLAPYMQGPSSGILSLYEPGATKCAPKGSVGTVTMTCDRDNKKQANFVIVSQSTDVAAVQRFVYMCRTPPAFGQCPGNAIWNRVLEKRNSRVITVSGERKTTTFVSTLRPSEACTCEDAVWAVFESGSFLRLPPKQCLE